MFMRYSLRIRFIIIAVAIFLLTACHQSVRVQSSEGGIIGVVNLGNPLQNAQGLLEIFVLNFIFSDNSPNPVFSAQVEIDAEGSIWLNPLQASEFAAVSKKYFGSKIATVLTVTSGTYLDPISHNVVDVSSLTRINGSSGMVFLSFEAKFGQLIFGVQEWRQGILFESNLL